MKKIIIPILLFVVSFATAQTVTVSNALVTPSPMAALENDGAGIATLTFKESLGVDVPATSLATFPTTTVSLSMQYIQPKDLDLTQITGTAMQYFTVSFNASTEGLRFKQSALIPANFEGTVIIPVEVITNSTSAESFNGFNANIAVISGLATAPGHSSYFTYTLDAIDLNADTAIVNEGGSILIDILDNDQNIPEDGTMTTSDPTNGSVVINDGGTPDDITDDTVTYTPDTDFTGPTDTFTYTICYEGMPCITETVTVTVNPLMLATEDSVTVLEDGDVDIDVLDNDSNIPTEGTFTVTQPTNGIVTIDNGGTPNDPSDDVVNYEPTDEFNGTDSFTYTVCDEDNYCVTETVSVTIVPVLDVENDSVTTNEEDAVEVSIFDNDNDIPSAGSLTVTQPDNGTVVIDNGGTPNDPSDDSITYTPDGGFDGEDVFTYTVCNNNNNSFCETATITVSVLADDDQDNIPNITDIDDDNDGILDTLECPNGIADCDFDNDGIDNHLDLDSDNDGIPDNVEAQATNSYVAPSATFTDTNSNGMDDAYETALNGTELSPVDSDDDGGFDFLDLDSDGDSFFDIEETGDADNDIDNDGMTNNPVGSNGWDNSIESADDYIDVNGVVESGTVANLIAIYGDYDNDAATALVVLVNDVDFRDTSIPDFIPTLLIDNATVIGATGQVDFRVVVGEYANNKQQKNKPVRMVINKSPDFTISFDNTLSTLSSETVNNAQWEYSVTPYVHVFTYVGNDGIFSANGFSVIGVNAVFNSPVTSVGSSLVKASIAYNSGGETKNTNNDDFDTIEYSNEN